MCFSGKTTVDVMLHPSYVVTSWLIAVAGGVNRHCLVPGFLCCKGLTLPFVVNKYLGEDSLRLQKSCFF